MTLLTLLDMNGFIFGLLGAILVCQKNKYGFLAFVASSANHGLMAFMLSKFGLMSMCSLFILIDIYYFYQWSKA